MSRGIGGKLDMEALQLLSPKRADTSTETAASADADILDRLAERQIERYRAAISLLELERSKLQTQLRASTLASGAQ